MKNDTYIINNDLVVKLEDEFDAESVKSMKGELEAYSELDTNLVFDLRNVSFIDSSGIGAMVFLYKRMLAKGLKVSVVGLTTQPLELFQMLMLDQTINCFDSIESYLSNNTNVEVYS